MKYKVRTTKDSDEVVVEEIDDESVDETVEETKTEEIHDEDTLTSEEIASLKQLAARAADLMKLLEVEEKEHAATADEDEEITKETSEEEVIDSEKIDQRGCDSAKAFGSIETKDSAASVESNDLDIEAAWSKRFNGGK